MWYHRVVEVSRQVAATTKRSAKVALLAALLREADPDDAPALIGLLLAEPRQGRLGVGWSMLRQPSPPPAAVANVTVGELDAVLEQVSRLGGAGSTREREQLVAGLLARLTDDEQDHLRRVLSGEMRQGANSGVVTEALARAVGAPLEEVRRASMLLGDLGIAARRALAGESLDVGLTPMVGVQPMLAGSAATLAEAIAATGPASVEWKLDGARVQVHRRGGEVRVFTRSLREIAVPTIVEAVLALPGDSFVLDGEALALDAGGHPLKFQDSMSTGATLRPFFFDLLHVDGTSLIDEPLSVRKALLAERLPAALRLPALDTADADAAESFAAGALAAGHEGVMVKALDSPYVAGRRGVAWRKVKPVHTLDLVVLAAEWGHGRRRGLLSNLHLGARVAGGCGAFVMVGKTFKGLTDELLRWQTEELQRLAVGPAVDARIEDAPTGDGWMGDAWIGDAWIGDAWIGDGRVQHVRPELVVEIAVDGVQRSSRYPGGVALRFARVRRYRPDKRASEADTIERVQAML